MAKILIAYFSHTGENYFGGQSVKEIRQLLQSLLKKAVGGDLFEIRTVKDYPVNYKQCTDIAAEEGRTNARHELRGTLPDMSGYNTIITKYAVLYKDIHFQKRHGCHRNQIYIHVHLVASSFSLRKTRYYGTTDILSVQRYFLFHKKTRKAKMYKDVHFWRWGMGRSFNGSYAEYALLPTHHVFAIQSDMTWADIAAVPETYFTAWGSLFQCLRLQKDDTLLVRGGTCVLGYAAMQIAKAIGCRVAATTHRESKLNLLKEAGADECILDTGNLSEAYNARFYQSDGVYLTGFHSNFPTQTDIDSIFISLTEHTLQPLIGAHFAFRDIAQACAACDGGKVNGKIVVEL